MNKGCYTLSEDTDTLLCDGKQVLCSADFDRAVTDGLYASKGSGCRKLKKRIDTIYAGISEREIHRILGKSRKYQRLKARFLNKPLVRPIKAKYVHARHQIDLMSMQKWAIQLSWRNIPIHISCY